MSGWEFEGANPIANLTIALEVSGAIMPPTVREIANKHSLFKRDLPRRQEQPILTIPMFGNPIVRPQAQIGGLVFDSVNSDGSVARALSIAPNQISYMSANYSR